MGDEARLQNMNKEEVALLVKQYSNDTSCLSFIKREHPAYEQLVAAGKEILPFLLERLKDSIGHDDGDSMDNDNFPWLILSLIGEITVNNCWLGLPNKSRGKLKEVRNFLLKWGESQGLITL